MKTAVKLVGYASGIASNNVDTGLAPWYLQYHNELFQTLPFATSWSEIFTSFSSQRKLDALAEITTLNHTLAQQIVSLVKQRENFCVIGGDHSCAIGTWSGVANACRSQGDIGLIWIDAHMDSHTPETSNSQNIHGMPLAHLLGSGFESLLALLDTKPKLKPENVCLIGIRSYQPGEHQFLENLGVKIIYMEEVLKQGIGATLDLALAHVSRATIGVGISIDLDGIDPVDAPGVGYREANGISAAELLTALAKLPLTMPLLGLEIAEYNPLRDEKQKTAKLIVEIIRAVYAPRILDSLNVTAHPITYKKIKNISKKA
ncbi:MAG: arginase [Gammaproteobacteria bacterium]|nr:arginase [Gammaproteobacteria bacterium]